MSKVEPQALSDEEEDLAIKEYISVVLDIVESFSTDAVIKLPELNS